MKIRSSTVADDPAVRRLLEAAGLPAADVETGTQEYLLAYEGEQLVGTVGLERVGADALARSLAVIPDRRGRGIGHKLLEALIDLAQVRGVGTLYSLTTTAEQYAAARGFEKVARSDVPPAITGLAQFRALCPATAVCMRRKLG